MSTELTFALIGAGSMLLLGLLVVGIVALIRSKPEDRVTVLAFVGGIIVAIVVLFAVAILVVQLLTFYAVAVWSIPLTWKISAAIVGVYILATFGEQVYLIVKS